LTNGSTIVTAISAGDYFTLALRSDGTLEAFGDNSYGQTNIPAAETTNIVSMAAGGGHCLALNAAGNVIAWGLNTSGQTNLPSNLNNVIAVAAGGAHSVALLNDRVSLYAWGDNSKNQLQMPFRPSTVTVTVTPSTNSLPAVTNFTTNYQTNSYPSIAVKLIAAGGNHTMAAILSPLVQYQVDVSKDLLLIYNTNSLNSSNVCQYYLTHRPMVSNANVLGIDCTTNSVIGPLDYTNVFLQQVNIWLSNNPTKRPLYVVLCQDLPQEVSIYTNVETSIGDPSVQYQLHYWADQEWHPFVTAINMNGTSGTNYFSSDGTNDCIAYIDKLVSMASNNPPGTLFISGTAAGYSNINWYIDESGSGENPYADSAAHAITNADPTATVFGTAGTNLFGLPNHSTHDTNVAGYYTCGSDCTFDVNMFVNTNVQFFGYSGWFIITTLDSFDGQRRSGQASFLTWFASNSFGGTNYSNTPIGAATTVEEPFSSGKVAPDVYYGDWAAGKPFAIAVWAAHAKGYGNPGYYFQAVGDPFAKK